MKAKINIFKIYKKNIKINKERNRITINAFKGLETLTIITKINGKIYYKRNDNGKFGWWEKIQIIWLLIKPNWMSQFYKVEGFNK